MMNRMLVQALVPILVASLVGCSSQKIQRTAPVVPEKEQVLIDPQLLVSCDDLSLLPEGAATQLTVVKKVQEWSSVHTDCKNRHDSLVVVVRKAFNIPATPGVVNMTGSTP